MPTSEPTTTKPRITIPTPEEIQAELDEMTERGKHLRSLLKVSKRAYGVADADDEAA